MRSQFQIARRKKKLRLILPICLSFGGRYSITVLTGLEGMLGEIAIPGEIVEVQASWLRHHRHLKRKREKIHRDSSSTCITYEFINSTQNLQYKNMPCTTRIDTQTCIWAPILLKPNSIKLNEKWIRNLTKYTSMNLKQKKLKTTNQDYLKWDCACVYSSNIQRLKNTHFSLNKNWKMKGHCKSYSY